MIARIWHGITRRDRADAYAAFLDSHAMSDYRSIPGNLGSQAWRRDEGEVTHFITLSYWDSEDAIRAFAGDDLLKAKYYAEDADFLLEFEPQVMHYEVTSAG